MPETSEQTPNTLVLEQKTTTAEQDLSAHNEDLSEAEVQKTIKDAENFLASQLSYEEIAKVFIDAHDERVAKAEKKKRGLILEMLVDNPAKAFKNEFKGLERLYGNRTVTSEPDILGSVTSEFCTSDHDEENADADYFFRHSTSKTGREKLEVVKAYDDKFEGSDIVTVSLMDDEFHVVKQIYKRGEYGKVELEGDEREAILAKMFYDTIEASGKQMGRGADDREENDRLALGYLKTRHTQQLRSVLD